jgi:uncharacterized protein YkwD
MKLLRMTATVVLALALAPLGPGWSQEKKADKFELSADEKKLLELTNAEREKEKLQPLKPNPLLVQAARAHAANMAKQEKLEHVLDGKTPAQRVRATGYVYTEVAENISWGEGVSLQEVMRGWMKSPLHRDNILKPGFREIGLAAFRSPKGELWCVQVFGTPRKQ